MHQPHLHFGDNTDKCKSCVPSISFRVASIGVFGLLIGITGLLFVETPPSFHLLAESKKQNQGIENILEKLNTMEVNLSAIKDSLEIVKGKLVHPAYEKMYKK